MKIPSKACKFQDSATGIQRHVETSLYEYQVRFMNARGAKEKTAVVKLKNFQISQKHDNKDTETPPKRKTGFIASNEVKLVVVGSVGSGKTTSLHAVSEVPVIGTESKAGERAALHRKKSTTIAMEYGLLHMQKTKLHLYGTPGQRRFDFMVPIICMGAAGMIVMIDNGCDDPMGDLDYFLNSNSSFLSKSPGIIAVTHFDDIRTRTGLIDYHRYVIEKGFSIPVVRLDAREKSQVRSTITKLLIEIIRRRGTGKVTPFKAIQADRVKVG